jgi:NAD-dependent SIR2 family protein deacetylase
MSESVDSLLTILESRRPWIALTGAGISSASGIPTYRDHKGTWLGSQPIQHDEFISDASKRQRYWSRSALGWPRVSAAQPNEGHTALVKLEQAGLLAGVITQNVDRLHQRAGSQRVIDLHGRLDRVRCLDCGYVTSREAIQNWIESHNALPDTSSLTLRPDGDADLPAHYVSDFHVPQCRACGGVVMPEVVFFGGTVPSPVVDGCYQMIDAAEGMLVVGSSLSVYSGLRFCRYAVNQGKPLIILNKGQTRADDLCTHKFSHSPFTLMAQCADHFLSQEQETLHG